MVNNFLTGLLYTVVNLVLWFLSFIASLVVYPIQALVVTLFPRFRSVSCNCSYLFSK